MTMTGRMGSPMMMLRLALVALLLTMTSVSAKTNKLPAFMKSSPGKTRFLRETEDARKNRLMRRLLAKAQPRRQLNEENAYGEFSFDASQFSVKYAGCSAINTYSDERAEKNEGDSVLEAKRFVVFRLCPSASCSSDSLTGCSSDYGEYVLEMGDYLEAMAQYTEERLNQYCEYCQQCYEAQAAEEDAADAEDADANEERRLEEAEAEEAEEQAAGDDAVQEEAVEEVTSSCDEICSDYNNLCDVEDEDENENGEEEEEAIEINQFFECMQYENENDGSAYYLGPHCASDEFSITIGLYSDEDCTTYIGHETSVYNATGLDLSGIDMSVYYPQDCQSCLDQELVWQDEDGDGEDDNQDEVAISEMCESLYMASAKCHKAFETANAAAYSYSAQQEANEEQVCNFIDNIVSGKYDEDGEIIIDVYKYNISDWANRDQYIAGYNAYKKDVTPAQVAGLVISILGCFFLCITACVLHSSLTKKGLQWRPRRGKFTNATDISRQNSGIVMGRSRSGPNPGPLV